MLDPVAHTRLIEADRPAGRWKIGRRRVLLSHCAEAKFERSVGGGRTVFFSPLSGGDGGGAAKFLRAQRGVAAGLEIAEHGGAA